MEKGEFTRTIDLKGRKYDLFDIHVLEEKGLTEVKRLPFAIRIFVENLLRKLDHRVVQEEDLIRIAGWEKRYSEPVEIPYYPARVLMQDFTGVPAVVDLAAMRDAVGDLGGDPNKINPLVPVDLIVDHSVQVDYYGTADSLKKNVEKEYQRNWERYALLKWAQKSFDNFKVVPPNSGICHQVNLEYLGKVIIAEETDGRGIAYPDTLVGTDSHTPMINGIGVMGWGVGGIEAEAVMLGQPYYIPIPEVIGVRMVGELDEKVTATDLVLTITELLRTHKVVEKFVEYFGPGMKKLSVPDRATIANMTPEHGATLGFFPVDEQTVEYLRMTDRKDQAEIVERYTQENGLFYKGDEDPEYTEVLELDLSTVGPSVAGPARPQDRIALKDLKENFGGLLGYEYERDSEVADISRFHDESGNCNTRDDGLKPSGKAMHEVNLDGREVRIGDGSVVIAAITSCTNTSNPFVMLGAGLIAKKAVQKGLRVPPYVKTSLAPGSKVVMNYLEDSGLQPYLEALGFHLAGFGCTTCIGNSGPLRPEIEKAISENDLSVAAVLSGNRNFEARIHQSVKWNFLASPMLVVAFAISGRVDTDLTTDPIAFDPNGEPVYLKDIWPKSGEIKNLMLKHVKQEFFRTEYERIFGGDSFWDNLQVTESTTYAWDDRSTYIKKPPYFDDFSVEVSDRIDLNDARALLLLGDSVTTDHISPAGAIPKHYPAGQYLIVKNVDPDDFNSYGSRRGNHEVMIRGTFGNIRIKNQLVTPKEGSFTRRFPAAREMFIYDAAMAYQDEGRPLVVLGGKEYGTGSSRDWAAKGPSLLGVRAIFAESFERIHRSNLVGMGILPLMFKEGDSWKSLGLDGSETYSISGIDAIKPRSVLHVKALKKDGSRIDFEVIARLDTEVDVEYYKNGGILPYVLRKLLVDEENGTGDALSSS
ncbi:MAG: aconitate hydratase AcnA [Proteobacteria bacterium]|nr:aconitate hydratase AcnA [Pseudomonadota bacterium]NIS70129.1 aconitate hydratase AcnA [Pseudomonadota bacterium]